MAKIILGIESSCDETAAAILKQEDSPYLPAGRQVQILSNIIGTSAQLQQKFGGIIPEQAAREQLKLIIPVIKEALKQADKKPADLDAIAVTYGPGLIGSLLVGVEAAKTLATVWQKPLIPVNHLIGHFYANWIQAQKSEIRDQRSDIPTFPCLGLLVSGGHSDLVLFKNHGQFEYLGGTRDDAAGECFDKCARLIGYSYPGGPKISQIAQKGNPKVFKLPRPMWDSDDFDFSFSGLKTAFANLVEQNFEFSNINPDNTQAQWKHIVLEGNPLKEEQKLADLCASLQQAIIDSLINKVIRAAKTLNVEQIIIAGGVAANQKLVKQLCEQFKGQVIVPPPILCTDNAAMIASAAFFIDPIDSPLSLQANPNLSLAY